MAEDRVEDSGFTYWNVPYPARVFSTEESAAARLKTVKRGRGKP